MAEDGVYVLALKRMLPNEQPPLKDVEAKVTEDYRQFMAAQFAIQAGRNFANSLTNGLPAETCRQLATTAAATVPHAAPAVAWVAAMRPVQLGLKGPSGTITSVAPG